MDIFELRSHFPVLSKQMQNKPLIYFDSAATTQKPKKVIDALYKFYMQEYATIHRGVYELSVKATDRFDATREALRKFLNAKKSEEIIFTRGTTEAINLVANSFGEKFIQENDEILISVSEHHSNLVPWQRLAKRKKAKLKFIPINERAELQLEELDHLLTDRTKLVAIAHIANSTGTLHPIETIIKKAHDKEACVLIDAAQSIAHLTTDVQKLDCDFLAFSSHKMYGPTGVGVLYGKKELLDSMPPFLVGGDMIDRVTLEETLFQMPPQRFEAGTPAIAEIIAFKEAIDFIETIGREKIGLHEAELVNHATNLLSKMNKVKIIGRAKKKGSLVSFVVDGAHPLDIGTFLDLEGIAVRSGHHCAQPTMDYFGIPGTVRISFGVYNTLKEVDQFILALERVISKLK